MRNTLAIITVIYENYDNLDDFIDSLRNQKNKNFHLYIADNSKKRKDIILDDIEYTVMPSENLGYAHGVNEGLQKAMEDGLNYFCIVNDDIFFKEDFVESVVKVLQKYPHSIIGGKIYYAPGYEYYKDRYTKKNLGNVLWYAGGTIDWKHAMTPHRGVDEVDKTEYNAIEKINFVNGCLMCFDKYVVDKTGLWDESYFMYFEDSDFCIRAQKHHIPLYYNPSIKIWHKNSQSSGGPGSALHNKYLNKNRLKFGLKYAPLRTKFHLVKNFFLDQISRK